MNYLPLFIPTLLETRNDDIINFAKLLQRLQPSQQEIGQLAYEIYESEGCPDGRQMEHWIHAEVQLFAHRIHEWLSENGQDSFDSDSSRSDLELENVDLPDFSYKMKRVCSKFPRFSRKTTNVDIDDYPSGAD